jgi:DNA repair protein RadC
MHLATVQNAAALFRPMLAGSAVETVAIAYLREDRLLIEVSNSPGETNRATIPFERIIAEALRRGAAGLMLAHNHPSGDPTPSETDIAATRRLSDTAFAVGLRLYDHLVFAGTEYRSFRAMGLL